VLAAHFQGVMPWKDFSAMDERMQFVASRANRWRNFTGRDSLNQSISFLVANPLATSTAQSAHW
jgi:hypothetical protein